ncbi:hypothetical protein NZD88_18170 [Chryseobacterium antibioticum]|uniref:Uncharacterized protein n=1 Tax=Chryseobacterium pyrolae TaxID=2987481 RepID=A0ABT2ILE9_9FLAO|nr:hypothetical protein [Chryseobacterium pyrolae]MCT2409481.1 hypothetical protein [Chryseobacterium pyrolae]
MEKKLLSILGLSILSVMYSQVGINTSTPQKNLHVNGALQVTNEFSVGGSSSTPGSAGLSGQVLKSNGPGQAPVWETIAGVPTSTGTVIAVAGQFLVAQEITVQMTSDFTTTTSGVPLTIGNLNSEIIDNENLFTGSASTNSFKVSSNGVYQVMMNGQLSSTISPTNPVIGIWDDTANRWVARVNDDYTASVGGVQTYTLITSIPMLAANTYSFRMASSAGNLTMRALSSGGSGSGPVTQVSLRRLK